MGLWGLLGGEVNWEHVARMQNQGQLNEIHQAIMNALGGALSIDNLSDDNKNNVMWVLEKFGKTVPTTNKYPFLKKADGVGNLHHKRKNQPEWDQAWEWYDDYKKGDFAFLEYRIQIRKKELEEHEDNLRFNKAQVEKFGKNRTQIKLIKSYERDIPKQKEEIAKLKA